MCFTGYAVADVDYNVYDDIVEYYWPKFVKK